MELKAEGDYKIRFRHVVKDIGPLIFTKDTTLLQVKERLLREWPREDRILSEVPKSSNELLLIISGKLVDESKSLFDYRREMGDFGPGSLLTIHLVIRRPPPPKNSKKNFKTGFCCCFVQ